MNVPRSRLLILAAAMLLFGVPLTGFAQPTLIGTRAPEPAGTVQARAPEYGTATQSIQVVSITEFRRGDSAFSLTSDVLSTVYYYQDSLVSSDWWARPKLPAGSIVDSVELDSCDSTATGQIQFVLVRAAAGGTTGSNVTPIGGTGVAATPGCGFTSVAPSSTLVIDNQTYNYWIAISFSGDFTPSLKAAGFRVHYHLQVSPGPSIATFPLDVPTTHPYFRFVEALASAGITAGCGTEKYCPDSPVTRGQIAVFLAAALGLHFPN